MKPGFKMETRTRPDGSTYTIPVKIKTARVTEPGETSKAAAETKKADGKSDDAGGALLVGVVLGIIAAGIGAVVVFTRRSSSGANTNP